LFEMQIHRLGSAVLLASCAALAGCGGGGAGAPSGTATAKLSDTAQLGKTLFHDPALSASGQQACASCHVEDLAFQDGNVVSPGGPDMQLSGVRNTPPLMYTSFTPPFHFESDGTPVGGFFRDGRALTLADQAMEPFITPFEMANADAAAVLDRLKTRPYYPQFLQIFGQGVASDPNLALQDMGQAIAAYEREDADFRPFTSKYDYWLKGQAQLTAQEQQGFALFNDPSKGNCAACHVDAPSANGTPPLFTDFTYDNLGVPRNTAIPANSDSVALPYVPTDSDDGVHRYYDLGLCGPLRNDQGDSPLSGPYKDGIATLHTDLCGAFKVPTLRDIAVTAPYFHNGIYSTLQQAVTFYVTRDTDPAAWYPAGPNGTVIKFDDLPAAYGGQFAVDPGVPGSDANYLGNVNTVEVPYDRHIGEAPRLDAQQIEDVVAFLCTLTDGYDPAHPDQYFWPRQCQAAEPISADTNDNEFKP
jgi:Cytochrome c peroxidase